MITFNIRTHLDAFVTIAADSADFDKVAAILDDSDQVVAFNVTSPIASDYNDLKYSKGLSAQCQDADTDKAVAKSIMDAIREIQSNTAYHYPDEVQCQVIGWVGSPGDYSPPECNCPRCVRDGRGYNYRSYGIGVTDVMYQYFYKLLIKNGGKEYQWGVSYTEHAKCEISLHDHDQHLTIYSNKPEIRIGAYVFVHKDKTWKAYRP